MDLDRKNYPWAEYLKPDDRIGPGCTYDPFINLPLFREEVFETHDRRIGPLRYYLYDPTAHGYPKDRRYPLLFALHGATGSLQGRVAVDWAGAGWYASEKYQKELGGMFIVCPLANEWVDEEGVLHMAWTETEGPGDLSGYSDAQQEALRDALQKEPGRESRMGAESIYLQSLRSFLKFIQEENPAVDPEKTVLFGTSAGGFMAWRLLCTHPEDYALGCIMAGAGLPSERELERIAAAGTRILVCHARHDELVSWDVFVAPNLEAYSRFPNVDTWFPEFARNGAKEVIDCIPNKVQLGQHCINNCIQQNLIYDDGSLYDPRFPEGMTGYVRSVLNPER